MFFHLVYTGFLYYFCFFNIFLYILSLFSKNGILIAIYLEYINPSQQTAVAKVIHYIN
jgi:hypothetical protein